MTELKNLAVQYFEGISAPELKSNIAMEAGERGLGEYPLDALPVQSQPVYVNGVETKSQKTNLEAWEEGWLRGLNQYAEYSKSNLGYPFSKESLGSIVRVRPVKDLRSLYTGRFTSHQE